MRFTIALLDKLKAEGKIRGYQTAKKEKPNGKIVAKEFTRGSREKQFIEHALLEWCSVRSLQLVQEYRFAPPRKWRADYAVPAMRLIIEYEGIVSKKSRHTTMTGYSNDSAKYNQAAKDGWTVLRYTALNFRDIEKDLQELAISSV